MITLSKLEKNFLYTAVPRILEEFSMFRDFEHLNYANLETNENTKDLINYRRGFILYGFLELTGSLFFINRTVFEKEGDKLLEEYIEFAKLYDKRFK